MDTTRFLRLRGIFDEAIRLPECERAAFLDRECAGDAELRAEAQALWEAYLAQSSAASPPPPSTPEQSIGVYRLQSRIGEGGMGSVFLAVRDDGAFEGSVSAGCVENAVIELAQAALADGILERLTRARREAVERDRLVTLDEAHCPPMIGRAPP